MKTGFERIEPFTLRRVVARVDSFINFLEISVEVNYKSTDMSFIVFLRMCSILNFFVSFY